MHTTCNLPKTPFEQGFLNLSAKYIDLVGNHLEEITIFLGSQKKPIRGKLHIKNPVVPRIRAGKEMIEWFKQNCEIGETLNVSIINPITFWVYKK